MAESEWQGQAVPPHQDGQWGGGGEYDAAYHAVYAAGGAGGGNGAAAPGQPAGGWGAQQAGFGGGQGGYYDEHGGYYDPFGGYYDAYGQYFPAAGAGEGTAPGSGGLPFAGGGDAAAEGAAAQAAAYELENAVGEGVAAAAGHAGEAEPNAAAAGKGASEGESAPGAKGEGGGSLKAAAEEAGAGKEEKEDDEEDDDEDEDEESSSGSSSSSESSDTESGEDKKKEKKEKKEKEGEEDEESEEEPVWAPKETDKKPAGPRSMADRIAEKHREEEERGMMAVEDEESDAMRQEELRAKQYLDYLRSMFEADMAERAARERQRKLERAMLMEDGFAFRSERLVSLRRWKNTPGALIREMRGHEGAVLSLGRALRGEDVVSASADCTLRLWRLRTGQCVRVFRGHSRPVQSCAVSTDGRFLASASADLTAIVWDLRLGVALRTLQGHSGPVRCVAFSPDTSLVATGGEDRALHLWDTHSGRLLERVSAHTDVVSAVSFVPLQHSRRVRPWAVLRHALARVKEALELTRDRAFAPRAMRKLGARLQRATAQRRRAEQRAERRRNAPSSHVNAAGDEGDDGEGEEEEEEGEEDAAAAAPAPAAAPAGGTGAPASEELGADDVAKLLLPEQRRLCVLEATERRLVSLRDECDPAAAWGLGPWGAGLPLVSVGGETDRSVKMWDVQHWLDLDPGHRLPLDVGIQASEEEPENAYPEFLEAFASTGSTLFFQSPSLSASGEAWKFRRDLEGGARRELAVLLANERLAADAEMRAHSERLRRKLRSLRHRRVDQLKRWFGRNKGDATDEAQEIMEMMGQQGVEDEDDEEERRMRALEERRKEKRKALEMEEANAAQQAIMKLVTVSPKVQKDKETAAKAQRAQRAQALKVVALHSLAAARKQAFEQQAASLRIDECRRQLARDKDLALTGAAGDVSATDAERDASEKRVQEVERKGQARLRRVRAKFREAQARAETTLSRALEYSRMAAEAARQVQDPEYRAPPVPPPPPGPETPRRHEDLRSKEEKQTGNARVKQRARLMELRRAGMKATAAEAAVQRSLAEVNSVDGGGQGAGGGAAGGSEEPGAAAVRAKRMQDSRAQRAMRERLRRQWHQRVAFALQELLQAELEARRAAGAEGELPVGPRDASAALRAQEGAAPSVFDKHGIAFLKQKRAERLAVGKWQAEKDLAAIEKELEAKRSRMRRVPATLGDARRALMPQLPGYLASIEEEMGGPIAYFEAQRRTGPGGLPRGGGLGWGLAPPERKAGANQDSSTALVLYDAETAGAGAARAVSGDELALVPSGPSGGELVATGGDSQEPAGDEDAKKEETEGVEEGEEESIDAELDGGPRPWSPPPDNVDFFPYEEPPPDWQSRSWADVSEEGEDEEDASARRVRDLWRPRLDARYVAVAAATAREGHDPLVADRGGVCASALLATQARFFGECLVIDRARRLDRAQRDAAAARRRAATERRNRKRKAEEERWRAEQERRKKLREPKWKKLLFRGKEEKEEKGEGKEAGAEGEAKAEGEEAKAEGEEAKAEGEGEGGEGGGSSGAGAHPGAPSEPGAAQGGSKELEDPTPEDFETSRGEVLAAARREGLTTGEGVSEGIPKLSGWALAEALAGGQALPLRTVDELLQGALEVDVCHEVVGEAAALMAGIGADSGAGHVPLGDKKASELLIDLEELSRPKDTSATAESLAELEGRPVGGPGGGAVLYEAVDLRAVRRQAQDRALEARRATEAGHEAAEGSDDVPLALGAVRAVPSRELADKARAVALALTFELPATAAFMREASLGEGERVALSVLCSGPDAVAAVHAAENARGTLRDLMVGSAGGLAGAAPVPGPAAALLLGHAGLQDSVQGVVTDLAQRGAEAAKARRRAKRAAGVGIEEEEEEGEGEGEDEGEEKDEGAGAEAGEEGEATDGDGVLASAAAQQETPVAVGGVSSEAQATGDGAEAGEGASAPTAEQKEEEEAMGADGSEEKAEEKCRGGESSPALKGWEAAVGAPPAHLQPRVAPTPRSEEGEEGGGASHPLAGLLEEGGEGDRGGEEAGHEELGNGDVWGEPLLGHGDLVVDEAAWEREQEELARLGRVMDTHGWFFGAFRRTPLVRSMEVGGYGDRIWGHLSWINCCRSSHDGTLLVTTASDNSVKLWDMRDGALLHTLLGHEDWVYDVAFSPHDDMLATASADQSVRLWSLPEGKELRVLRGHVDIVTSCVFSLDGTRLVSASMDRTLRLWQLRTYRPGKPEPPVPSDPSPAHVTLTWSPPSGNGSVIQRYLVLWRDHPDKVFDTERFVGPHTALSILAQGHRGRVPPTPRHMALEQDNKLVLTVAGLKPGRPYQFKVCAENAEGQGEFSDESAPILTLCTPPKAPTRVMAQDPTRTSVVVTWMTTENGGAPYKLFRVHCAENRGGKLQDAREVVVSFYDVCEGVSDRVGAAGKQPGSGAAGEGDPARSGTARTAGSKSRGRLERGGSVLIAEAGGPVDKVSRPRPPSRSLQDTEQSVASRLDAYGSQRGKEAPEEALLSHFGFARSVADHVPHPVLKDVLSPVEVTRTQAQLRCRARVDGLAPGRLYQFRVAAESEHAQGPYSGFSGTVLTAADVPSLMDPPKFLRSSTDSITVAWGGVVDNGASVQRFRVRYERLVEDDEEEADTGAVADGLDTARTAGTDDSKASAAGASLAGTLQSSGLMSGVQSSAQRRQLLRRANRGTLTVPWHQEEVTVSGLLPGFEYVFSVSAANGLGFGPWSAPCAPLRTVTVAPRQPNPPRLRSAGCTSLFVEWATPSNNGDPIEHFMLRWREEGETAFVGSCRVEATPDQDLRHTAKRERKLQRSVRMRSAEEGGDKAEAADSGAQVGAAAGQSTAAAGAKSAVSRVRGAVSRAAGAARVAGHMRATKARDLGHGAAGFPPKRHRFGWVIRGLRPDCGYEVAVCAVNSHGPGPLSLPSPALFTKRAVAPPPPLLRVSDVRPTSLRVTVRPVPRDCGDLVSAVVVEWEAVEAKGISPLVLQRMAAEARRSQRQAGAEQRGVLAGRAEVDLGSSAMPKRELPLGDYEERSFELRNMRPGTVYAFSVAGRNSQGRGKFRDPQRVEVPTRAQFTLAKHRASGGTMDLAQLKREADAAEAAADVEAEGKGGAAEGGNGPPLQ